MSLPTLHIARLFRLGLLLSAAVPAAFGQYSYYKPGSIELGGFVGASYGVVDFQYMLGGNLTVAANKRLLFYGEYTWLPKVTTPLFQNLAGGSTYTADRNV